MEYKRYYFKLEMEQLPDDVWNQFKATSIVREMGFKDKVEIVEQIENLPGHILDNLKSTLRKVRDEERLKLMKAHPEKFGTYLVFAVSEGDDWFSAEEDEAWKDL